MKVILTRMPALEAALLRFDTWWNGLSRRERILVGTLGALLAAAILIYGVVKPIQSARAAALADIRTYETLTARIRAAGTLTATPVQRRTGPPEQVATSAAQASGLAIVPEAIAGGVRVTVADASYDAFVAWLANLAATSDLRVRQLTIQRRDAPGHVSATVELAG
ncbi:MAG: type II secretion system protein M [Sphingomonadales bacterium]|nr:MAG: type II secretion system protein M [Sphingomonadales bacterium]